MSHTLQIAYGDDVQIITQTCLNRLAKRAGWLNETVKMAGVSCERLSDFIYSLDFTTADNRSISCDFRFMTGDKIQRMPSTDAWWTNEEILMLYELYDVIIDISKNYDVSKLEITYK